MSEAHFDIWVENACLIGVGLASVFVAAYPPPWQHDWFVETYRADIEPYIEELAQHDNWSEAEVDRFRAAATDGFRTGVEHLVDDWPSQRGPK